MAAKSVLSLYDALREISPKLESHLTATAVRQIVRYMVNRGSFSAKCGETIKDSLSLMHLVFLQEYDLYPVKHIENFVNALRRCNKDSWADRLLHLAAGTLAGTTAEEYYKLPTAKPMGRIQAETLSCDEDKYHIKKFPRPGRAIIICLPEFSDAKNNFPGIAIDGRNLRDFFIDIGFDVKMIVNKKSSNKNEICKETIIRGMQKDAKKGYAQYAMLVCAVISQGTIIDGKSCILDYYNEPVFVDELIVPFKGLESLAGKPKMFICHSCKVSETDNLAHPVAGGAPRSKDSHEDRFFPHEPDILILYSSVKGFVTVFGMGCESNFVRELLIGLRTSGDDVVSIFTKVIRRLVSVKHKQVLRADGEALYVDVVQTLYIVSTLTAKMYLRDLNEK